MEDRHVSATGLILGALAIMSTFDWTWLSSDAWRGGTSPMTIVLLVAAIIVGVVDYSTPENN